MTPKTKAHERFEEGLRFEAKAAPNGIPEDFWETYSSFANTFGGTIALGLSEDENRRLYASGVTNEGRTVKTLWDNLNNPRFVNINLLKNEDVEVRRIDGKKVIFINVPAADRRVRPVYIRNNLNSGTFKRNHEGDYHCRMDEIKEMIRDSEDLTQDNKPIMDMDCSALDKTSISRYLNELSSRRAGHPWTQMPVEEFLSMLGATVDVNGVQRPTVAGLLMFGKVSHIRRMFNGYFLDYREAQGPEGWSYRMHSNSGEWSGNVYDFVSEVMNRISLKLGSPFALNGYSSAGPSDTFIAVREAVLNAVIHSDYFLSKEMSIVLSPNFIVIKNPGTMRVRLDDAKKGGYSDPRNGTLMAMAMAIGWVERIGSGIHMMEKIRIEGGISRLRISECTDPSSVTVTIGLDRGAAENPKDEEILNKLKENPRITRDELAKDQNISVRKLANILAKLKSEGRIDRVGSNKNGYWSVNDWRRIRQ